MAELSRAIPKILPGGGEPLVSYDYTDLAEGTGVKTLIGFTYANGNASGAILVAKDAIAYTKNVASSSAEMVADTWKRVLNVDFDLSSFNAPRRIKGTAYFLGSWNLTEHGTAPPGGAATSAALIIKIKKWDGTAETTVAQSSSALYYVDNGATYLHQEIMKINIPVTSYKIGETLRVGAEVWAASATNVHYFASIFHDPQQTDISGAFKILIPFKLDV